MIRIFDISWHQFKLEQEESPTVGSLYNLAQKTEKLFVFQEKRTGWSAVVIPELLIETVNRFNFDFSLNPLEVGLVDILRRDQLTVAGSRPAVEAAELALANNINQIIVVDEGLKPVGLFIPTSVAERLKLTLTNNQIEYLRPVIDLRLQRSVAEGGLIDALREIDRVKDSYHSENLNLIDPELLVCQAGGSSHYTSSCPCPRPGHSGGPCERRQVNS